MFSHIHLGTNDLARSFPFYSALLDPLGLVLRFHDPEQWAIWQRPGVARPLFIVGKPFDGQPASPGNGPMTALLAERRSLVDLCYRAALDHGGTSEGAPGLRPQYHANYYGAYFRDPDGNKLCVACHEKE
ncbi:putative lactoylglutathione lyase [Hartmannibacter diazotrophicus]|uniref:Putative lactoylglutathione lyase n=1 Tax=Hartmannibacter diazotrophicus TaxID=1482074 RepID=A0A2C9DCJ2_9HYPH|nr:VOC family protein [Hartmannibacter diazotrophicus]SON57325.1 putative lactoylglutathione lyase [Hartmannibacter diazotrophicus]